MTENDDPVFWVRDDSGTLSRPSKRKIRHDVTSSDIRVCSAIANCNLVQDCRNKTLFDMCLFVCVRHVNSINWENIPQHTAATVLTAAHHRGTISDSTLLRLVNSQSHTNFINSLLLTHYTLHKTSLANLALCTHSLEMCDFDSTPLPLQSTSTILRLYRLKWLGLSNTGISDEFVKRLVYPTKYRGKGLIHLQYLDISCNPEVTQYGVELATSFPKLTTLISLCETERFVSPPPHYLYNWGHDLVIQWIVGPYQTARRVRDRGRPHKYNVLNFYKRISKTGEDRLRHHVSSTEDNVLQCKPPPVHSKPTSVPSKPTSVPSKPTSVPSKPTPVPSKPTSVPSKPTSVPSKCSISGKRKRIEHTGKVKKPIKCIANNPNSGAGKYKCVGNTSNSGAGKGNMLSNKQKYRKIDKKSDSVLSKFNNDDNKENTDPKDNSSQSSVSWFDQLDNGSFYY